MSSKSYTLPILLLYLITSCIFLLFFSLNFYQDKKSLLLRENLDELKELTFELAELNINIDLKSYENLSNEIKINIYKNGKVVKKEFETPNFEHSAFVFDGKFIYIKAMVTKNARVYFFQKPPCTTKDCKMPNRPMHMKKLPNGNYEIVLQSANLAPEMFKLIIKICFISFGILSIILLIAYFIVKLSFKNMQNQLNQLNSFIIDTTHEINTPLCIILMSIEMFKANPDKYLNNIKTASRTLSSIYDDLVRLNLIDEKNEFKNIDIKSLIEQRIEFFTPFLEKKRVILDIDLKDLNLISDENKLTKILDNLMSNAIKYSKEDSRITLILQNSELKIINYNAYIKKANLKKVFEKFKRFDKQNGGFGVGLSIVKKYCDDLSIKISCKSDEDMTEFKLEFKS